MSGSDPILLHRGLLKQRFGSPARRMQDHTAACHVVDATHREFLMGYGNFADSHFIAGAQG
jgi:hypothetical protein